MRKFGNFLIIISGLVLLLIFAPVAGEEGRYQVNKLLGTKYAAADLTPPNTDFAIVIPKIGAVSTIVPNVDSQDPKNYLPALKKGVAHAKGTALPDEVGNVFLFAHSTDAFYNVGYYNAVFYLIGKLQNGDEVDIYYKGKLIKYVVYDKKVVSANDTKYFGKIGDGKTLTLQTCYPPGTTLERLVVLAKERG